MAASTAAAPARSRREATKVITGAGIGNVLEWYDFTVYAYLATIIGAKFFSSENQTVALLATFGVFGVGFAARPLGGILIGLFGDKYGRKPALLLAFGLMAFATGMIGFLPTYETIGIAAPILLVVARLMQGVSAGGEWGSAASFLVEWAPERRKGFFGSFHPAAICVGQLLGATVTGILFASLGDEFMEGWGWRIPFLLGILIAPMGIWLRRRVDETPAFREAQREVQARTAEAAASESAGDASTTTVIDTQARRSLRRGMVLAFFFPVLQSVLTYLFLSYFPTFAQTYLGLSATAALFSTVAATAVMGASALCAGALSDRLGRRPVLLASCGLSLVLAYPLLSGMLAGIPVGLVVAGHLTFAVVNGLFLGAMPAALVELFETRQRLFGLTTGYNLQSMIFGGFAPFIASGLIAATDAPISIAGFIMLASVLSGAAVWTMRETAHEKLA